MTVEAFSDRIIRIKGTEYLYFGGTSYLGITTHSGFQTLLFESIKKWGTAYGSSRNSNIELSVYTAAEKLLAETFGTSAALTVSSGMLAGKLVVEYLSKTTDSLFHFPNTHPALLNSRSLPIFENGRLHSKLFDTTISKITILADAIPSLEVQPIDLSILFQIPKEKEITLVIDESHSLGILGSMGEGILSAIHNLNIHRKIGIASMGKAYGLSGGVIAADPAFISDIRNQDAFIGSSGMNPAFLDTFVKAQELYQIQLQKLRENLYYFDTHFINRNGFTFDKAYPIIYFDSEVVSNKLLKNKIITTSFKYPTSSGKLNRIVITANHTQDDLDQLLTQLNTLS